MAKRAGKKESFDCLLPTGLLLTVDVSPEATFNEVKKEIWSKAMHMPLFAVLQDASHYGLRYVNKHAEVLEVDDDQTVGQTQFFSPLLKVFPRKGSREEQRMYSSLAALISKSPSDFDSMRNPEVNAFRRDVLTECLKLTDGRRRGDTGQRALHRYTPSLDTSPLSDDLKKKAASFMVKVKSLTKESTLLKIAVDAKVNELIQLAVKKDPATGSADSLVLRLCGRDDYLLGNHPLYHYKLVRRALARGYEKKGDTSDILMLQLEPKQVMLDKLGPPDPPVNIPKRVPDEKPSSGLVLSTSVESKYGLKIVKAIDVGGHSSGINRLFGVGVKAGIFYGEEMICKFERSRYVHPDKNPNWGEGIEFEIDIKDLPRSARLCFLLHGVWANPVKIKNKNKNMRNEFPLAWANISVFDYRNMLRSGEMQLPMWASELPEGPTDGDEGFVPLGTTMPNPSRTNLTVLTVEFTSSNMRDITYPDSDQIDGSVVSTKPLTVPKDSPEFKKAEALIKADPLYRLTREDKALLRKYRFNFQNNPAALSKCLNAIEWSTQNAAQEVAAMLKVWARPTPEQALGLLDSPYADLSIRKYAVGVLDELSDDKLTLFLLQLVQVLKYELYLDCDLARLLLRRALSSQRVGHFFFWNLKSEMHLDDVSTRYGLMLEAFCRSCEGQMHELTHQSDALQRLEQVAEELKKKGIKDKDKLSHVNDTIGPKGLGEFQLPLDPSVRVGECECRKVFDSAQKPLWFKFRNVLSDGPEANVMFKHGDDLRQDMLTLQLIRVMDMLWQEGGEDMQMSVYDCLATGDAVGMLEMVMNSATLWKIQGKVSNVWDDTVINSWLKAKNPGDDYSKACDLFLRSCAGYSVATFVLGIADRHNDNIMLKETGQLFHIDFGHFLGNWKAKFGVRRERVKFILVPDFVYAMTMGGGQKSARWKNFKDLCRRTYLIVRRNADLFINLLNMMMPTGIPELRSRDDVNYLRDTLYLGISEDEAAERFMQEIDTALRDSKTVKVNWAFHGVRH